MSNPPASSKTEISMTNASSPFHPIKKIIVQSLGMARLSSLALHCTTPPAQEESKVMPCPAIDAIQSNQSADFSCIGQLEKRFDCLKYYWQGKHKERIILPFTGGQQAPLKQKCLSQISCFQSSTQLLLSLKKHQQIHPPQCPQTHQIQVAAETTSMSSPSNRSWRTAYKLERK